MPLCCLRRRPDDTELPWEGKLAQSKTCICPSLTIERNAGIILWFKRSGEHGGVKGMTLYALGPSDCLLLVLIAVVIFWLLPKKILRQIKTDAPPVQQRPRIQPRALGKQI